jgi:hypothetical protein
MFDFGTNQLLLSGGVSIVQRVLAVASLQWFSEDAFTLTRKIFEFSLHMQAIATPCADEQRRHRALCFIYDGDRQRLAKLAELAELKKHGKCVALIDEIDAAGPALATVAMPANFASPRNLKDMAAEIGGEWQCWYALLYWSSSKLSHPSGLGSHTYLQDVDPAQETGAALSLAVAMHYELIKRMLPLLGLDSLMPQLDACMGEFVVLPA